MGMETSLFNCSVYSMYCKCFQKYFVAIPIQNGSVCLPVHLLWLLHGAMIWMVKVNVITLPKKRNSSKQVNI